MLLQGLPNQLNQLSHAYVVEGSDQILLTEQAFLLSKTLLCSDKQTSITGIGEPCGQCHSCKLFEANNHPDFLFTQAEKNSIGVDEIRQTSVFLTKTSQLSGAQVVLIENANSMTESASNALLKTLEEPTNNSYLLLLSNDKSRLLPTIRSRCQFLKLDAAPKQKLKQIYPDLADYILGFGSASESNLKRWIETEKVAEFELVYQTFILWLKKQTAVNNVASKVEGDEELQNFLLYLISRRIRQYLLKQRESAVEAQQLLIQYQSVQKNILGLNKPLAMNTLLTQLTPLIA